ncbi:MAG: hypothetical protein AB7F40_08450 [Victivallaceae bacterium]|nr:hypothetical protein [Victivallaceae bacterium]
MKNKIIIAALATAVAALGLYAQEQKSELAKLQEERASLTWQIVDKRAQLIASDAECKKLHEQIMAMHRELAIRLNSNPDMRKLTQQTEELDRKIAELKQKESGPTSAPLAPAK